MLLSPSLVITGCNRTLAPEGVYAGDKVSYDTDLAVSASKNIIQSFLNFELQNRAFLAQSYPQVTQYADKLRTDGKAALQSAAVASKAYHDNPTAQNKAAFDKAMAAVDALVAGAQQFLATTGRK